MKLIDELIEREGDFVDHPSDKGGPTCWGITEAVARADGYLGHMKDFPREWAERLYWRKYISAPGFDKVLLVSPLIGEELIDTGVNMGETLPGPWLQRTLNLLNQQARAFPDLVVDGQIGPATISALRSVLDKRGRDGELVIMRCLNCLQGNRYFEITEKREKNEDFFFGWLRNRVVIA